MSIPDSQFLELYDLLVQLLAEHPAREEKRIVFYMPDLFVEMAKEIMKLKQRVASQVMMEMKYRALQVENMALRDDVRDLKKELKRQAK